MGSDAPSDDWEALHSLTLLQPVRYTRSWLESYALKVDAFGPGLQQYTGTAC
jgi:hypothetical protein